MLCLMTWAAEPLQVPHVLMKQAGVGCVVDLGHLSLTAAFADATAPLPHRFPFLLPHAGQIIATQVGTVAFVIVVAHAIYIQATTFSCITLEMLWKNRIESH